MPNRVKVVYAMISRVATCLEQKEVDHSGACCDEAVVHCEEWESSDEG